jgi:uncharacterized lipoprotein NlpE involved in copper resistance
MRNILLAAALAATTLTGCSKSDRQEAAGSSRAAEAQLATMTVDEVDQAIAANEAKAVDCNSPETRKKMGIVPGAIMVSDHETFAASELPADKNGKLVFYCANEH